MLHEEFKVVDKQFEDLIFILFRTQFQRLTPRGNKCVEEPKVNPRDPVFIEYHKGRISRTELCRHFGVHDSAIIQLLVEEGELFHD